MKRESSRGTPIETLESRRLLAITIDSAGIVHATGTSGNDVLRIDFVSGQYRVTVNNEVQSFNSISGFRLDGLAGNDWLLDTIPNTLGPGSLSRTMIGGDGNDNFWEVASDDTAATISGGAGDDTLHFGSAQSIRFDGGTGRDALRSTSSARDFVNLEEFPTVEDAFIERGTLTGNALGNHLVIAEGPVSPGPGDVVIRGNGGNDVLEISTEGGRVEGGDGDDSLIGGTGADTLDGGAGNDTLRGNGNDDTLYGRAGFDLLDGGAGDDHLFGFGDGATDTLVGGAGHDRASRDASDSSSSIEDFVSQGAAFIDESGVLTIEGSAGNDRMAIADHYNVATVTINGYEYLFDYRDHNPNPPVFNSVVMRGFAGDDYFDLHGNGVRIEAGDGDDTIDYFADNHIEPIVFGGNGNDTLIYTRIRSDPTGHFDGGAGRDEYVLKGFGSVDLRDYPNVEDATTEQGELTGNALANVLTLGIYGGTARGGDGNDTLSGEGSVELYGENGNDTLIGTSDPSESWGDVPSVLSGGAGNDTLRPGVGDEILQGGDGLDTLDYSSRTTNLSISLGTTANDGAAGEGDNAWFDIETVNGGSGNDLISATGANNVLRGNGGNDLLRSFGGNDALFGGSGNDRLEAGAGNDYLEGNAGNDALLGEAGTDLYLGHDGDDWIYARDGVSETLNGGNGFDRAQRDPSDSVLSIESFIA